MFGLLQERGDVRPVDGGLGGGVLLQRPRRRADVPFLLLLLLFLLFLLFRNLLRLLFHRLRLLFHRLLFNRLSRLRRFRHFLRLLRFLFNHLRLFRLGLNHLRLLLNRFSRRFLLIRNEGKGELHPTHVPLLLLLRLLFRLLFRLLRILNREIRSTHRTRLMRHFLLQHLPSSHQHLQNVIQRNTVNGILSLLIHCVKKLLNARCQLFLLNGDGNGFILFLLLFLVRVAF